MRWKFINLMFVYNKMPDCHCGKICSCDKVGCTARRALPARFTKKGKSKPKVSYTPRVHKKKLY